MSLASLNSINRKILATQTEIANIDDLSFLPKEAKDGLVLQLNSRLLSLKEEKRGLSYSKELISIRLHGENVETGKISVRILSNVLSSFQALANSVAQVALGDLATAKGKISQRILDSVSLNVNSFYPGSFGVLLENIKQEDTLDCPVIETALAEMFSVFECGADISLLADQISPYGVRFTSHYKEFLENALENKIDIELNWTKSNADQQTYNISHNTTLDIINFLDNVNYVHDTPVIVSGEITMIDIRGFNFNMETADYGHIRGKSKYETLLLAKDRLGSRVEVSLIKSECFTGPNILKKESWYLEKIL